NFFSDIVRADAEFIIKNDSAKTLPIDSRIDVKIKLGDSSVIEDLNQFVENQPDDWYPYFQRGFYYGLSEDSLRMKDFNRAIKFSKENSNTISIYQTIAGWHSDQLNWGASIEWYTQAINLKDNYLSRLSRGICYYYLNSPTSAIKDFEVATVLNTKKTEPFLWIGLTYLSINDTQKALEYYDVAISISNDLNEIFMTIYDLVEFKQYEEALQYLDCLLNEKKLDRRDIFYAKYFKFICYQRLDNQSEVNRLNDELIKFPLPFEAELKDHILYLGYTFLD
ncbi:MAG: hypothetical protein PSN34_03400, partial [Urechidicola sp.]|nr:hypothetical protein [Urechidicola sp.]